MLGNGGKGRDVVSMTDREKARRLAPIRAVESYWLGLCAEDKVPLRSQVDPRGMESALENAFLMEKIAPTMGKVRVAGTHLSDLMGMQIAGMPLSTLIAPADREKFGQAIESLFAEPAVIRIDLRAEGGFGKPDLEGHMIIMPLRSDFGDISRALGALVTQGRIGRTPRRFSITHIEVSPALNPAAVAKPALPTPEQQGEKAPMLRLGLPKPAAKTPADSAGFEEPRKAFQGSAIPAAPQRGHLRLVVSND
ncbi:PAS domain-containing protein [Tropicibacter oceani]|uniref:PAS domain-containing protein n=1 Tax=Tropicibacter oceani TaxID=3058420 RepID=A0ABY8QFU4_9RHOB|nr:PAS domain-containing protein [Tropicibacter oceani]WGW02883.1 PAS domain-containing protein [Tropicibacter oceani]